MTLTVVAPRTLVQPDGPFVDAEPVRRHVRGLQAAGIGWRRVAELAGLSPSVLTRLLYGGNNVPPSRRVRRATAERILAVQIDIDSPAAGSLVDATGTRRRLQALVAIGWAQTWLAAELGLSSDEVGAILHTDRRVRGGTDRAVRALYEQWWDCPPPQETARQQAAASHSRKLATSYGWAPPMAWDDAALDDPDAVPDGLAEEQVDDVDEIAVELACEGKRRAAQLRPVDRDAAIRVLAAQGMSVTGIVKRLRTSAPTVQQVLAPTEANETGAPAEVGDAA
ncbi:hypothetical protein [Saccharopolyspora taberi]|uniref:Uncharacterized protein n=1 Tax=Saccharopolyspora taberi TaxID=60895 RepID=A0ABN3VFP8_9PSEU